MGCLAVAFILTKNRRSFQAAYAVLFIAVYVKDSAYAQSAKPSQNISTLSSVTPPSLVETAAEKQEQSTTAPLPSEESKFDSDDDVRISTSNDLKGTTGTTIIKVRGLRPQEQRARSAAAVTVVDLERAKRESADLAEVLARVEGVNVQRAGGLGSAARFSLAGFDDTQIRFFIDGIPLEYQGFSMGLQNVPLGFSKRIDVYKGVVPVKLGADSLGGAFNLITDRRSRGTHAIASYQGGSFDTQRLLAAARHRSEETGFFVKAEGFYDASDNDYPIDVEVGTSTGDLVQATVRRFHDAYEAYGVNLETGIVGKKWANRLLIKGFLNSYDKELPHNALMTVPFGEAEYGGVSRGLHLRYENYFGQGLSGSFVTGYVYDKTEFVDVTDCFYDWYGGCIFESREPRGEVGGEPIDQEVWDHTGFARWNLDWEVASQHKIVMAMAPTYFIRNGNNKLKPGDSSFDPLRATREMFKWVNGVEYRSQFFREKLENIFFVKNYLLASTTEEALDVATQSNQELYWGLGNGIRYSFNEWSLMKASYEYAVRIPEPREMFGNGVNIIENIDLNPERSHNVNLSFLVRGAQAKSGTYSGNLTGFFRDADDLILLIGRTDIFRYENAYKARVYGVEGATSWLAPGDFVELGLNATYQEYQNNSTEGSFSQFKGERIPNKPYLFGNATARFLWEGIVSPSDQISFTWYSRYTHEFLRFWESVGSENGAQPTVPNQFVHSAVLNYLVKLSSGHEFYFSAECQNLTNEKVYDFYRVQRAGRAIYGKFGITY